jgi:glutathione S-transferase
MALAESMAINLYLAKRYGRTAVEPLYPEDPAVESQIWRWSLWAQGQLEPWVQRDFWIADLRTQASENFDATVRRSLSVLERALQDRAWLACDHFTVGDLNVAAVLSPSRAASLDFAPHPKVEAWLARCYGREKAQASRARYG